jgi:hypothetical protein
MALALSDTHTHTYIHMHTHTLTHSHLLVFFLVARLAPRHEGHSHSLRVLLVCDGCTHTHIEMYVRTCMPRHYGYTLSLTHTHTERCTHTHTHTHSHTHTRAVPTHASPSSLTNVCARKGLSFSPITALRPGPTCADQTRVHCACYSLLKPHTHSLSLPHSTLSFATHTHTHTHIRTFSQTVRDAKCRCSLTMPRWKKEKLLRSSAKASRIALYAFGAWETEEEEEEVLVSSLGTTLKRATSSTFMTGGWGGGECSGESTQ